MTRDAKYNLFILIPNFTDEQIEQVRAEVAELIKKHGLEIVTEEKLGKRKLSYPIKKMRHGYYFNYVLLGEQFNWPALQKDLLLKPEVLRFEWSHYMAKVNAVKNFLNYSDEEEEKIASREILLADQNIKIDKQLAERKEKPKKENKISLEELDQKLDDLLEDNNV